MTFHRTAVAAACSLAVLLSLAACGERTDGQTLGQERDSAVTRSAGAAAEGRQSARTATADTGAKAAVGAGAAGNAKDASQEGRTSVMGAAADTRQVGSGAGQAAAGKVDDAQITSRVSASLMGDKELSNVQIDVDTRDGVVTLSGPVPSSTAKARANEIAHGVKDVKSVNNQLTVSAS